MDRILPQSFLIVQRRVDLMTAEGIRFITNSNVGQEISAEELHKNNDAVSFKRKIHSSEITRFMLNEIVYS